MNLTVSSTINPTTNQSMPLPRRATARSRRSLSGALFTLLLLACLSAPALTGQTPSTEQQILAAVQAAPADRRDAATVLGYDENGELGTLRDGSNDLVCLADDPSDERFQVACYHESLEPFMARGRELTAQGIGGRERRDKRFAEIEAGTLQMPREPRMLYVTSGSGFDSDSGEVADAFTRWVIYVPFATGEELGMATTPSASAPWLMDAGTAGAHIMITPPRN